MRKREKKIGRQFLLYCILGEQVPKFHHEKQRLNKNQVVL